MSLRTIGEQMDKVYFDNSATTKVDPRVLEEMLPYFTEQYGNASSLHSYGRDAYDAMELARERTAKALGASPRDIIFTSGGTESDNLALQGAAYALAGRGRHIITSKVEHHAITAHLPVPGDPGVQGHLPSGRRPRAWSPSRTSRAS